MRTWNRLLDKALACNCQKIKQTAFETGTNDGCASVFDWVLSVVLAGEKSDVLKDLKGQVKSSLEGALIHVHIITDNESASRGNQGNSSIEILADKSIPDFILNFRLHGHVLLVGSPF